MIEKEDKPEVKNAIEELEDLLQNCVRCGLCKGVCPVFKVLHEEFVSPRGKAVMLNKGMIDKVVFDCTLCKACENKCPAGIKLCDAFRKARLVLSESGKETKENKEMIENIKKYGNPFGKDKGESKKLYCC